MRLQTNFHSYWIQNIILFKVHLYSMYNVYGLNSFSLFVKKNWFNCNCKKRMFLYYPFWAGSLNQCSVIASNEPISKAAHLIAIFKKMAVVSRKHFGNTHRLGASEPLVFPAHHCHFSFKDSCFIGSTW